MDQVTTPIGVMNVAGPVRSNGSVLFDLFIALISTEIILELLGVHGYSGAVGGAIIVCLYIVLAYRGVLPSLGRWALGLHRYKYSQIDEYEGKGTLVVYENLESKIYSARAVISALVLVCLYLAANFIVLGT